MVILVDDKDNPTGRMPKLDAHKEGTLHRAISVLIFNGRGEMLVQRRALTKYHSPGLWANACCSHPLPGESPSDAAVRRLEEELGIHCDLFGRGKFIYKADVGGGLTEHEYDHIFTGVSDREPVPNPGEVMDFRYMPLPLISEEIRSAPGKYAVWFRLILSHFSGEMVRWKEKKQR